MLEPRSVATDINPLLLDELETALRNRISVGHVAVTGGRVGSVQVDRIEVGEAAIDKVTIEDFSARVKCGSVLLRNLRAILELHFEVHWSYDLKWFGSDQGVKALGSKAKTIPLHDLRIPMLQDIAVDIPQVDATEVAAHVQPVADVTLGGASFDSLALDDTRLPSSGFQVSGLSFASFEIDRFGAPDADSGALTIARFQPDQPLRLPDLAVANIELPEVAIPDVGSPEAVSLIDIQPEPFEAPVFKIGDLFKAIFVATPVLHLQIGELVLSDLSASAAIGAVQVQGVTTLVTVQGVRLGELVLGEISAERISV